ncbi:MAG: O-antigen ligase family protein [Acidobacteria bacterium]|nr:O-antigen ligase family protein [Acidobacteriota bacterium]
MHRSAIRAGRAAWLARGADVVAGTLFAYLVWRMFFDANEQLQAAGALVGIAGLAAAAIARRAIRTPIDLPVLAYLALCVLSTEVNAARFEPPPHMTVWQPTLLTCALVLYYYGASAWLARSARLAFASAALVAAIAGIGIAADYDYLTQSVAWRRMGAYPSVGQWSGYPQIGLLLTIALAMPLALMMAARRRAALVAGGILVLILAGDLIAINSRSALVVGGGLYAAFAAAEVLRFRRWRLAALAGVPAICFTLFVMSDTASGGAVRYWFQTRLYLQYMTASGPTESLATGLGRFSIWRHAGELIRENPWLGVGPSKYSAAFRRHFAGQALPGGEDAHAHNSTIHIATETGIPSALAFLAIWAIMLWRLTRAWPRDGFVVVVAGVTGALLAYFLRSFSDHFPASSLISSTRVSFLMWTLLAMGAAALRVVDRGGAAAHG